MTKTAAGETKQKIQHDKKGPSKIGTNSSKTTAIGDEGGGFSYVSHGHKSITYAITEIRTPERFVIIAKSYPKNTRNRQTKKDELSWYGSEDWVRDGVLSDISKENVRVYLSTEKNDPDNKESQRKRYQKLLKDAVNLLLTNTDADHIDIVLDNSDFLSGNVGVKIIEDLAKGHRKTVTVRQAKSHEEPLLQTHDFVAGAASEPSWTHRIKDNIVFWKRK